MIKLTPRVESPGSTDGLGNAKELTQVKSKTLQLIQEQIEHEMFASRLYLSMAVWLDAKGYPETAKFFAEHAPEERGHAMWFVNFLLERGEKPIIPATELPPNDFETEEEIFTASIDHEKFITQKIADIYAAALEEGDIMALEIARKLSVEQIEEEAWFLSLYNLFKLEGKISIDMEAQMAQFRKKGAHITGKL